MNNKIEGIKALGAEVRLIGANQDEAQLEADRLTIKEGMTYVSPFDNIDVIAGQGTLGLEIHRQIPPAHHWTPAADDKEYASIRNV